MICLLTVHLYEGTILIFNSQLNLCPTSIRKLHRGKFCAHICPSTQPDLHLLAYIYMSYCVSLIPSLSMNSSNDRGAQGDVVVVLFHRRCAHWSGGNFNPYLLFSIVSECTTWINLNHDKAQSMSCSNCGRLRAANFGAYRLVVWVWRRSHHQIEWIRNRLKDRRCESAKASLGAARRRVDRRVQAPSTELAMLA